MVAVVAADNPFKQATAEMAEMALCLAAEAERARLQEVAQVATEDLVPMAA